MHVFLRLVVFFSVLMPMMLSGCTAFDSPARERDQVVVLGMIHGGHRTSEHYGIETLKDIIRRIKPDYILCEIPPDRMVAAQEEFAATGHITEPRVRVFPEYVDVAFPLQNEMGYTIVPCAGWTKDMAGARRAMLEQWSKTRPEDTREMEAGFARAEERIATQGGEDNPRFIHTNEYDEIVRTGMEPYQRLFGDDLGPGGWDTINASHYVLIEQALEEHGGNGHRFLITFGAWHKYWILDQLHERDDIEVLDARAFLPSPE